MMWLNKYRSRPFPWLFSAQLLCLLLIGALEFIMMVEGHMYNKDLYSVLRTVTKITSFVFCFVTILRPQRRLLHNGVLLAVAMTGWFLCLEVLHRTTNMGGHFLGLFLSVYMLAFPFASVTQDQHKQTGLRIISGFYIAAALCLLVFGFFLLTEQIPPFLRPYLYWDGTRLHTIHHPNITARILMIAIALCLGFFSQAKSGAMKGILMLMVALLFGGMALTNSRACMLITCLLMAANLFFAIYDGTFKRFVLGAAVTLLTMVLLYNTSGWIFQQNSARLLEKAAMEQPTVAAAPQEIAPAPEAAPAETDLPVEAVPLAETPPAEDISQQYPDPSLTNPQGSLLSDLATFNSRTLIWAEVFRMIRNDPWILLRGTGSTQIVGEFVEADHPHNAWLEILLRLGLPGFVMSLIFTVQAIWSAICLLWHTSVDMWKKNLAMLLVCLLVTSTMEPLLFFTQDWAHFIDFLFFLGLGYLILWRKQLRN